MDEIFELQISLWVAAQRGAAQARVPMAQPSFVSCVADPEAAYRLSARIQSGLLALSSPVVQAGRQLSQG
jgi:hypothetical protein